MDLGLFRLAAGTSAGSIQQVQKLLKIVGFIRVSEDVWEKVPELKLGAWQWQQRVEQKNADFADFSNFFLGIQTSR